MTALQRLAVPFLLLFVSLSMASPLRWPLNTGNRQAVSAGVYVDSVSHIHLGLPAGWRVRAETINGVRQLRVVPPKADQRERAAIEVIIRVRPLRRGETFSGMAQSLRQPLGDREAAEVLRYTPRSNRLLAEYREGRYVSNQLWIVRHNLNIWQRIDKTRVLEARCAANASEYKTYRKSLETICYSAAYVK